MPRVTQGLTRRVTAPVTIALSEAIAWGRGAGEPPDTTAPVLSSPIDTVTGSTTASIGVTTDDATGTLYWVVTASATPPSKAQVKAGQNSGGTSAAASGSQAISSSGAKTAQVTGLTADTAYTAHFMHEDAAGNQSNVATANGLTTYTSEAQAYFAAMSVAPDATRKGLLNTLVKALKTAGVWSKLDVVQIYASHDSAAALINAKQPGTFNASAANSPTFATDRGYTSDGVASYVNSGFNPATAGGNFTQNSACFGLRSLTVAQKSGSVAGWITTNGTTLQPRSTSDIPNFRINQSAGSNSTTPTISSGALLIAANRSASNATQLYIDGSARTVDTSPNQTSTALVSNNLYLGRSGSAAFQSMQFASCYIGASLDATEHAALAAADLAYMQAVGAA